MNIWFSVWVFFIKKSELQRSHSLLAVNVTGTDASVHFRCYGEDSEPETSALWHTLNWVTSWQINSFPITFIPSKEDHFFSFTQAFIWCTSVAPQLVSHTLITRSLSCSSPDWDVCTPHALLYSTTVVLYCTLYFIFKVAVVCWKNLSNWHFERGGLLWTSLYIILIWHPYMAWCSIVKVALM